MILEMKIPSPGESITEVELVSWFVKDGDYVTKDQIIAEVDSDKVTLELPADQDGIVTLKVKEGDILQVGQVFCLINISDEKNKKSIESSAIPKKQKINTEDVINTTSKDSIIKSIPSPTSKEILTKKYIPFDQFYESIPKDCITEEDGLKSSKNKTSNPLRSLHREPLSRLRRKLSERLVNVKNHTAMLTTFNEVDMSEIFNLRNQYNNLFKKRYGLTLGFMSFFIKASVRGLKIYPQVNSMINGKEKIVYNFCDISVAISGPKGLMVPVVRNAENLSFRCIEQEIKRLALRVRDGKISIDEMRDGTFTITNGGVFGSMLSTPIINPPQSAILGMHNITERPMVIDRKIEIRPIMYLALSYDHRIIDGRESVGFLVSVKEALENPIEILMDGAAQNALEL